MRVAFTLAEVLVTLTILGILASIIVPNVVQQYQKRVTITKLQKAYALLEGAAANLAASTGCVGKDMACAEIVKAENVGKAFIELGGLKGFERKDRWITYCSLDDIGSSQSYDSKSNCKYQFTQTYTHYLNSSSDITLRIFVGPKNSNVNGINDLDNYIHVWVITTSKYKNWEQLYFGKNVFGFLIYDNFIVSPITQCFGSTMCPAISNQAAIEKYCTKGLNYYTSGWSCGAKIIKDGWKINYW